MIPPIPPFVLNAARVDGDEDGGADNEYDFVEELESGLEKDLEPDDFPGQFEEELEKELIPTCPSPPHHQISHPSSHRKYQASYQ